MTDLQMALIGLAAAVLLGLFGYGKWQERRMLRQLRDTLREGVGDALFDAPAALAAGSAGGGYQTLQRVEPRLGRGVPADPGRAPDTLPAPVAAPERLRPVPGAPQDPEAASDGTAGTNGNMMAPAAPGGHSPEWAEDPLLDFVVELRCVHAVDGVAVYDAATRLAPGLLPTALHLVVWDARIQQWVRPDRFGFYSDLLVAAQLVDRRHVLTEIELSRFVSAAQQVALALDADFDPPDVARVALQAAELDRLCSRFDVRIGLTLESTTGAWDAAQIEASAHAAGLVMVDRGSWARQDAARRRLFTLGGASLTSDQLVLELDVPTAPADAEPLRQMFAAGRYLAELLAAQLVDDNGRPIDAASLAAIEAQLTMLYSEMRAAGIEPAGLRAERLYA
jgi:hypothetical protein